MARLYPIKGIRYNPEINMKEVIAPPYDVISPREQEQLYEKSPYNFIHLEYGYIKPEDDENNNRYSRAAKTMENWLEKNILIEDREPYFYLYEQKFFYHNKCLARTGLIAATALTPYEEGVVIPHEKTMSKPKEDRLNLLRHCQANFSPIFGLFQDKAFKFNNFVEAFKLKEEKPVTDFYDDEGGQHRLWQITDPGAAKNIEDIFTDKQIFIADGHHRYETALAYWQEQKAKGKEGFDRVMMFMFNIEDPGIMVLPTHRLVNKGDVAFATLIDRLKYNFLIEPINISEDEAQKNLHSSLNNLRQEKENNISFLLYPGGEILYLCRYKHAEEEDLDVSIIQRHLLEGCLGISPEQLKNKELVSYHKNAEEAFKLAQEEESSLAILLNHPNIDKVIKIASSGKIMPQKSTYFHPKLSSGLIINKLPGD